MYLKVIFKKSLVRKKPKYFKTALLFQFQVKSSSDGDVRHSLIPEVYQTINSITFPIPLTLFRKVKFLSKNSIMTKPQHFHDFFAQFLSANSIALLQIYFILLRSPFVNFVQFAILSNLQFCPICSFVQFWSIIQF